MAIHRTVYAPAGRVTGAVAWVLVPSQTITGLVLGKGGSVGVPLGSRVGVATEAVSHPANTMSSSRQQRIMGGIITQLSR